MELYSSEIIDGYVIEKYTSGDNVVETLENGVEITAIIKYPDPSSQPPLDIPLEPSQEEIQAQILLNTEYLVIMSEITNM